MQIFMFTSRKDRHVIGFTTDETGMNLPEEFAPWEAAGTGALQSNASIIGCGTRDTVTKGIKRDGFFIATSGCANVGRLC